MEWRFKTKNGIGWDKGVRLIPDKLIRKCKSCFVLEEIKATFIIYCDTEPIEPNYVVTDGYYCKNGILRELKFYSKNLDYLKISNQEIEQICQSIDLLRGN